MSDVTTTTTTNTAALGTVPLPSADLINYRFDQSDKQFDKLNVKLDDMASNFATTASVIALKKDGETEHESIRKEIDDIKTAAKWWVGTIIAVAAVVVTAFTLFIK